MLFLCVCTETQCHEVNELRRYLQLVADHSHSLEGAVRAAGGEDGSVPIGASLLSQAADVQASMLLCVRDAAVVRDTLTRHHEHHRPHMNALLNKMVRSLSVRYYLVHLG